MNWMGNLQQLGRSLMLPTIALPVAAIFLSLSALPWGVLGIESVSHVLSFAGTTIFNYLPFIFAVGVCIGVILVTLTVKSSAI